jgi:hypothetical protein
MCALIDNSFLHTLQTIEYDGSCSSSDIVDAGLEDAGADDGWDGESRR